MKDIAKKLLFDGCSEYEANLKSYYFCTNDIEIAKDVFFELYEDDLFDYAQRNAWEDEYEVVDCEVCLEINTHTNKIKALTITPLIEIEGQLMQVFPADIVEIEDELGIESEDEWIVELVTELLKKVQNEGE